MNILFFFVAALALSASGCVRLPCRNSREPQPLPYELTRALSYEKMTEFSETNALLVATMSLYSVRRCVLALPLCDRSTNKTIAFRLFLPHSARPAPAVIILPLSAGRTYPVEEYFARDLVRHGIAALVVERERVGASIADGARLNELLAQSVLDGKHLVDWLESRSEFDATHIGVLGVSLGAIRAALLMAADERVKAGVLGLVGGNLPDILTHTTDGAWRGGGITRRREAHLKEHRMTRAEFRRELAETIVFDPVRLAASVDPRSVRLVLGACDTVVPFRTGLALRRAMGKPETVVLPTGHYAMVLYLPWISREAVKFFRARFTLSAVFTHRTLCGAVIFYPHTNFVPKWVWGYTIPMIFNLALKTILGVLAVAAVGGGGYYAVKTYGTRALERSIQAHLDSGDYLAALGAAGKLKEDGVQNPGLDEQVASAARLLVAEDALTKATQAAEEKRFADASALLRGSVAVTDSSFKRLEEAKKLYAEVEALAASAAHKTAVAISALEEKAKTEQVKRQELEQNKKELEGTLSEREQSLSQSKAETAEARQSAEASRKEAEAKQAALVAEQARAKALMETVEKESRQKFFTELRTYRDMAQKGREQLDNAVTELNAKRDVTALIYVSQGKILFEEAKNKTTDLRKSRTPSAYQSRVDDLIKALGEFLEASKQLRNAVVYIEEQGSAEFTTGFSKGKTALANAASLLSSVSDFIAANP